MSDIFIKLVENKEELNYVFSLTHDAFVDAGLAKEQNDGKLIHYPQLDKIENTFIMIAVDNGEIIGTNTLTIDGTNGIHTDIYYKKETKEIRSEGRKLASSWRIAVKPGYRNQRQVVMSLIKKTFEIASEHSVETCLFTFYDKHEKVYQRLINATSIVRKQFQNEFYSDQYQILMRWDIERCPERWLVSNSIGINK